MRVSEKDIETMLEYLSKKYGIKKSNGYPVIMDIITHFLTRENEE